MYVREYAKKFRNMSLLVGASLALGGCLMDEPTEDSSDALGMESELSGSVGDGPVVNASMRALTADGAMLSEFESDASAGYRIMVHADQTEYPLIVDAWNGIDLVTGLAPDFVMRGAAVQAASKLTVNINPYSTLAIEVALDMDGGLTSDNIEAAQSIVMTAQNGGMTSLLANGPMFTPVNGGNIAEIVRASESLAEIVRRTRDWQLAFGFSTNADLVMEALGSDLIDNVIDGIGGSRSSNRAAAVATVVGAQVLLETMANELHVHGSNAAAAMESAIRQVSPGTVQPELGDLTVTAAMLEQVRTGLTAAAVVSQGAALTQLRVAVAALQPGIGSDLVKTLLPSNYRRTLENALPLVAGADDATLTAVNEVARSGGTDPAVNRAPTVSGTPPASVAAGSAYRFAPVASDPDGDALTFTIVNQPAWTTFDPNTGVLSGAPRSADAGTFNDITIRVSDGQASASLPAFSIAVTVPSVNTPPAISGTPPGSAVVGTAYSFTPSASDADGDSMTFSISARPSWLSFNTASGRLSGTPAASDVGVHSNIVISVSDGQASTNLPAFSIAVTVPSVNTPPAISGTPPGSAVAGTAYSFTPVASDTDGNSMTFSISARPSWLSFNTASGRLSGTPATADVGVHSNIVISVSDGQATASLPAFSITVTAPAANRAPSISGVPPASVNANTAYSFLPTAVDPDGDTLTFSVTGLPGWATFDASNGRINGTPDDADVGTYSGIQITVSDGSASAVLGPFSIVVQAISLGSVTLTWNPPTQNEDGTPLTDLAGYRFYWGPSEGNYPNSVTVNNPGITTYVVENLAPGTYVFVAKSINSAGVESQFSNSVSVTVR